MTGFGLDWGPPKRLRPFWRYYGSKWSLARYYPKPIHSTIVEPFAGSAGYSLHYPNHKILLIDKDPVIAGIWKHLVTADPQETLAIPIVDAVDDLPDWVPQPMVDLVGFGLAQGVVAPRRKRTGFANDERNAKTTWSRSMRFLLANQMEHIRHWQITEGSYRDAPDIEATWFVDPPYDNKAGSLYVYSDVDYEDLADWCMSRRGQVIVCENQGATWLPFEGRSNLRPKNTPINGKGNRRSEVVWTRETRTIKVKHIGGRPL